MKQPLRGAELIAAYKMVDDYIILVRYLGGAWPAHITARCRRLSDPDWYREKIHWTAHEGNREWLRRTGIRP